MPQKKGIKEEHPDAAYIKQDEIGVVIAKGIAVTYKTQPKNPVDFLAKWLLNHARVQKEAQSNQDKLAEVEKLKEKHEYEISQQKKQVEEQDKEVDLNNEKIAAFNKLVMESKDLNDQLQDQVNHVKEFTDATAVYVGKLVQPKKAIKDDDDDTAHLDTDASSQIHFVHSTAGHEFLVDKILKENEGITFDVFKEQEKSDIDDKKAGDDDDDDDQKKEVEVKEKLPHHVLVKEVVREPRMHYYKVPRLGSYLAIKQEYDSCLFESALDNAVTDYIDVKQKIKDQQEEKKKWEDEQNDILEQKKADGEEYNIPNKEWDTIEPKKYDTKKETFVVSLNTMGQDREFNEEQIKFALRCIQGYRDRWEKLEQENLQSDVLKRHQWIETEKHYKESLEAADQTELDRLIEEALQPKPEEEQLSEEERAWQAKKLKFKYMTRGFYAPEQSAAYKARLEKTQGKPVDRIGSAAGSVAAGSQVDGQSSSDQPYTPLIPEQWKDLITVFKEFNVIKMSRVWQTLFYLLGYDREDLCERDTNKLWWKKAKKYLNEDLFKAIGQYEPHGAKEGDYQVYQKMKFLQKNIESLNEDAIDEYSVPLGKLYRWVVMAIEVRIEDIRRRKEEKANLKAEREEALAKAQERKEKENDELEAAKQAFEEKVNAQLEQDQADDGDENKDGDDAGAKERPQFDEEEFYKNFNEANPEIVIPDEVEDDIDNDFDLEWKPEDKD